MLLAFGQRRPPVTSCVRSLGHTLGGESSAEQLCGGSLQPHHPLLPENTNPQSISCASGRQRAGLFLEEWWCPWVFLIMD